MTDMPELVGGAFCLDFVNTVDPRHTAERFDYLSEYRALVAWARHAGAIEAAAAARLLLRAARQPAAAREVLRRAIRLRGVLHRSFAAAMARQPPPRGAFGVLNQPGVFLCPDCRVGFGRVTLAFADGVDAVQCLRVVGLAHEEQVVIIAEDIPDLIDAPAHQLNLVLEVLPLRGMCRRARAD